MSEPTPTDILERDDPALVPRVTLSVVEGPDAGMTITAGSEVRSLSARRSKPISG